MIRTNLYLLGKRIYLSAPKKRIHPCLEPTNRNHGYEGMALDHGMDTKMTGSFHGNVMVTSQPRTGSQMVDILTIHSCFQTDEYQVPITILI